MSLGGPTARILSPEIATEAGACISNSPRASPRSGPSAGDETVAARSWISSVVSLMVPPVGSRARNPRGRDDLPTGPEDQRRRQVFRFYIQDFGVREVDLYEVRQRTWLPSFPLLTSAQQVRRRGVFSQRNQHVPPPRQPPG